LQTASDENLAKAWEQCYETVTVDAQNILNPYSSKER